MINPSLRVRVTGFSGHFTNLQDEMQDEIIKRTGHRMADEGIGI